MSSSFSHGRRRSSSLFKSHFWMRRTNKVARTERYKDQQTTPLYWAENRRWSKSLNALCLLVYPQKPLKIINGELRGNQSGNCPNFVLMPSPHWLEEEKNRTFHRINLQLSAWCGGFWMATSLSLACLIIGSIPNSCGGLVPDAVCHVLEY